MELAHRVALVTGAGSGIGKASAIKLAQAGARVIVHAHQENEARATADAICSNGGDAFGTAADPLDSHAMREAIERGTDYFGALQVIVANSGINDVWAPLDELEPADWDRTLNSNLRGTYLTLHYSIPHLKRAGSGSIVIISPVNGKRVTGHEGASACSTATAGLLALGQTAALELSKHHIRVNVVCRGKAIGYDENVEVRPTDGTPKRSKCSGSKIPPTGRQSPTVGDDIADAVLFLSSDRACGITGSSLWIGSGRSLPAD